MTSSSDASISFTVVGSPIEPALRPVRIVIAGYTARDRDSAERHIEELAEIGVPRPPRVPMFYEVPPSLATPDPIVLVDGPRTSGEVEPVLLVHEGRLYLGLGSDHTDRDVERRDVAASKASAPKPVSTQVVELERATQMWDGIELTCWLDGELYQQGYLAAMMTPDSLMAELAEARGALADQQMMFCGTLPLVGGEFRYGTSYQLSLRMPDGTTLRHSYDVKLRTA